MIKRLYKTNKFFWTILFFLFLFASCNKKFPPEPQQPRSQDVEITLTYSGTAICAPFVTHRIYFEFVDKNGETNRLMNYDASPDQLKNSKTFTIWGQAPGIYNLYVWWDWDDDNIWGPASYEQIGQPYPTIVNVEGYGTVKVNLQIVDRTLPSDLGRIEGTITYSGSYTGFHHLYVTLQDFNYKTIAESKVTNPITTGTQMDKPYHYIFSWCIPPGTYYRVVAYWDVNNNGKYDVDPIGDYAGIICISPGLPTVGLDIKLK